MTSTERSTSSAADYLPERRSLRRLAAAAEACRGCDLYLRATQTVFGSGGARARMVLVGEQPGDEEDRQGRPFVGPAGKLLNDVLEAAGIDRKDVYVTNAVKHFKWVPRGPRRLHARPSARQVRACRPWLESEIEAIRPRCVVCLGATAAQSLLGPSFRISRQRGRLLQTPWADWLMATYHPSAILRAGDAETRHRLRAELTADLRKVARRVRGL